MVLKAPGASLNSRVRLGTQFKGTEKEGLLNYLRASLSQAMERQVLSSMCLELIDSHLERKSSRRETHDSFDSPWRCSHAACTFPRSTTVGPKWENGGDINIASEHWSRLFSINFFCNRLM